jgi:Rrf2 family transcriptional regulator, nitric oxide-sensitive transcriptional repressor
VNYPFAEACWRPVLLKSGFKGLGVIPSSEVYFATPRSVRTPSIGWLTKMLSKTAEYALRAVVCMGGQIDRPIPANMLAERTKVPRRYLTRVLQDLCGAGLVRSRPGPGGGYELTIAPNKLTILDVVNTVDPIARIRKCPLGLKAHTKLCPLHAELDKAYAATERAFVSVTIQDLVESAKDQLPLCER